MLKKRIFTFAVMLVLLSALCVNAGAISKNGSRGEEVKKIQTKLKNWGYYNGSVDGVYGWQTENAVRSFQKKNNLKVDGVAGEKTLNAMGIYTTNSGGSSASPNDANVELLARVINGEARGEPYEGQVAVGAVVMNRVMSSVFPDTVVGVIYQNKQFSPVGSGRLSLALAEDHATEA